MHARDIMTREVVTVKPQTPVREAAKLMVNHRISGLPVVDASHRLVGIVTDGDLYRRAELGTERQRGGWLKTFGLGGKYAESYVEAHGRTIQDVMTTDVIAVTPSTPLRQIADVFEKKRIHRVPVVADSQVVGIVSRANLVQALAAISPRAADRDSNDQHIRDLVIAAYRRRPCGLPSEWNVIVRDGVVHLWGFVPSLANQAALRVAAEGIPGVKGFVDFTFGYSGPIGSRGILQSHVTVVEAEDDT